MASKKRTYLAKVWAAESYAAGIWRGLSLWEDPSNCPITAGVTMPGNTITAGVTITEATNSWDVTMPANTVTTGVGIGCGNQD
jgi:hypothetical protein